MAISERINPEKLNMHGLQEAPEGRPELPFDVERDISPETKIMMFKSLERAGNPAALTINPPLLKEFVVAASRIKLLWPNEEMPNVPTDNVLLNGPDAEYDSRTFIEQYDYAAALKILRPNLSSKINWNDIMHDIDKRFRSSDKVIIAALAKLMDPNRQILPKEQFDASAVSIDEIKKSHIMDNPFTITSWREFIKTAASMRLMDPTYDPNLSKADWQNMNEELKVYESHKRWDMYGEIAFGMKILAAHKVEITAPGVIDIQMYPPEDLNNSTPSIPEKRKF
jgi:hypothetical protein